MREIQALLQASRSFVQTGKILIVPADSLRSTGLQKSGHKSGHTQLQKSALSVPVAYGDGSFTMGFFSLESFSFSGFSVQNVAFGCGYDNEGLFVGSDGLLGLGGGAAEVLSCCAGTYWLSLLDALQRVECRELLVEVFYWKRKLVYRSNDLREYAKLIIFAGRLSYCDFGHEILNHMCAKGLKRKATIYNSLIDEQRKDKTIVKIKQSQDCQPTLVGRVCS